MVKVDGINHHMISVLLFLGVLNKRFFEKVQIFKPMIRLECLPVAKASFPNTSCKILLNSFHSKKICVILCAR